MRLALGVEYDGRAFSGWQTQPGGTGIQDALERALTVIADAPVSTLCAGRTDAGVHATAQVVHFDTTAERPLSAWVRGVNAHLPDSVAVTWAVPVADDFHARFSATGRRYRYLLLNRPVRPALQAGRAGWFHTPLDATAMTAAAAMLVGTHDFSAFRAAECQARSPVRDMREVSVQRQGDWISFDFEANAFLHHMIRNLVGALVYVGKGALDKDGFAELLARRDRRLSPPTFSPAGLYLCGVTYPDHWSLPGGGRIIAPVHLPLS
ncbi:MAG: tRNA pseudouridine(38-40) synthase TruA [Moraxellaceae bacterium]|nr:tRNA pseudouridine(38-40) synthase TruA [Moraxellaceae bacterium]